MMARGKKDPSLRTQISAQTPQIPARRPSTRTVVIGCGPGAIFISFLHALAVPRQKMEEAGDEAGLAGESESVN